MWTLVGIAAIQNMAARLTIYRHAVASRINSAYWSTFGFDQRAYLQVFYRFARSL